MLLWHGFAADNTAAKQTVNNPRWEPCLYTKPLVSELINGVTSHFSDAILVAGSTPQYKLRWVPPDCKETVSALFLANVVGLASCAEQTPVAEPGELSADDDDYGYSLDTDGTQEAVSAGKCSQDGGYALPG